MIYNSDEPGNQNTNAPQENKILHCPHTQDGVSTWKEIYNGISCTLCGLFYPDNCNWFAPLDDKEKEPHSYDCICEDCLQNHPERDILYGDGTYFNYPEDKVTCKTCGAEIPNDGLCWYCENKPENNCS